ncbi:MAG TPA: hypothetical protein PK304_03210 [Mobilitalea sp.]|nr:hypothetical protein [Mobilitalea sp.]
MEINVVNCFGWNYNKIIIEIIESVKIILKYLSESKIKASEIQEAVFKVIKQVIMQQPKHAGEYLYRKNNGYFECDTFQSVLDRMTRKG